MVFYTVSEKKCHDLTQKTRTKSIIFQDGVKNEDGTEHFAGPICLPWNENFFGFKYEPQEVYLAGWGFTSGKRRENLQAG